MPSHEFDAVKAEKARALRRYNWRRNSSYWLQMLGAFPLLLCSLNYCLPSVTNRVSNPLPFLPERFCALVLANVLIVVIYRLSVYNNGTGNDSDSKHDLYDEYVSLSTASPRHRETCLVEEKRLVRVQGPETETTLEKHSLSTDRQILSLENAGYDSLDDNPVSDLALAAEEQFPIINAEKPYLRSRSEVSRRDQKENCCPELRRTESVVGRELLQAVSDVGRNPDRKSLHEMNSEEFRLRIESFIDSTRKTLLDGGVTKESMAVTHR